jgi:hypothetical protein
MRKRLLDGLSRLVSEGLPYARRLQPLGDDAIHQTENGTSVAVAVTPAVAPHHEVMANPDDEIVVQRRDLITALRQLEMVVVSLDQIGSATADASEGEQAGVLRKVIVEWGVFGRLAEARALLGDYFSREPGPDDLGELERELHGVRYWSASNQNPPADGFGPDEGQTVDSDDH